MKKIKIAILGIIIIIIVLVICIIFIKPKNFNDKVIVEDEDSGEENSIINQVVPVKDANIFYSISYTIDKYFSNLYTDNNFTKDEIDEKKENLYNVLDKKFIEDQNIAQDNILEVLQQNKEKLKYTAVEMNQLVTESEYQLYSVKGLIEISETNKYVKDSYFIVTIDSNNNTYSIYPILTDEYSNLSEIKLAVNNDIESIEKNNDNEFIITSVKIDSIIKRYMAFYQHMALYNPEEAYNLLDKEYRDKRFENEDEFKINISNNKDKIENMILDKYKVDNYEDYTQYVIIDKQNNYYIFKETSIMQFSLMLDNYTIDSQEFIEKYNKGNEKVKMGMNIEKVITALNNGDYNYIYNKLDNSFKSNNFNTIEKFKTYMGANLFNTNKVEYERFSKEGEIYIYELKVKESEEENANFRNVTIIMKLLENTNFVMSFNIN